jgi:hypothetical protein
MSANIALMCKTNNNKQNPQSSNKGEYRVGNWVISETKRKELLGSNVVLTESQTTPAYLGGTIVGFNPTQNGKKCEVIFREDKTLIGNTDAIGHKGWGTGRSVCYI